MAPVFLTHFHDDLQEMSGKRVKYNAQTLASYSDEKDAFIFSPKSAVCRQPGKKKRIENYLPGRKVK